MNNYLSDYFLTLFGYNDKNIDFINSCLIEYNHPKRHYHNVTHLFYGLQKFEKIKDLLTINDYKNLILAWYSHDVIYLSNNNIYSDERLSAEWLINKIPDAVIPYNLVLSTEHTNSNKPDIFLSKILISVDLSILGDTPDIYNEYSKNVRLEYSQYSDLEYNQGRLQVLHKLINTKLFEHEYFYYLEEQAKINLHNEISNINEQLQNYSCCRP